MNSKFCPQCGSGIAENSSFCSNCGYRVIQNNYVQNNMANSNQPNNMVNNNFQNQNNLAGVENLNLENFNNNNNISNTNVQQGQKTNVKGIVGLILGIIAFFKFGFLCFIGLPLSISGLSESKTNGGSGKGVSIAGIVVCSLDVAFILLAIILKVVAASISI